MPKKIINKKFEGKNICDLKYLIFINDKHETDYKLFKKIKVESKKEYFKIKENEFQTIKKIFNENINKINQTKFDMKTNVLYPLLTNIEKNDIKNLIDIFDEGLKKYKFKNKRHDYETIKYLSFITLCYNSIFVKSCSNFSQYINNFKEILSSLVNLDYFNRIKVLLSFILNFNRINN